MDTNRPDTEIWQCDPLAIADGEGKLVYSGRCQIEFIPNDSSGDTGQVRAIDLVLDGWAPAMTVDSRAIPLIVPAPSFYFGVREGRTLYGHDEEGWEFTWYVNRDAEQFLIELATGGPSVPKEEESED